MLGNLSGDWLQRGKNDILASFIAKKGSDMLSAPS